MGLTQNPLDLENLTRIGTGPRGHELCERRNEPAETGNELLLRRIEQVAPSTHSMETPNGSVECGSELDGDTNERVEGSTRSMDKPTGSLERPALPTFQVCADGEGEKHLLYQGTPRSDQGTSRLAGGLANRLHFNPADPLNRFHSPAPTLKEGTAAPGRGGRLVEGPEDGCFAEPVKRWQAKA